MYIVADMLVILLLWGTGKPASTYLSQLIRPLLLQHSPDLLLSATRPPFGVFTKSGLLYIISGVAVWSSPPASTGPLLSTSTSHGPNQLQKQPLYRNYLTTSHKLLKTNLYSESIHILYHFYWFCFCHQPPNDAKVSAGNGAKVRSSERCILWIVCSLFGINFLLLCKELTHF